MEVRNSNFAAFIDIFTSNTYVMVIMSDPAIRKLNKMSVLIQYALSDSVKLISLFVYLVASAATLINIRNAKKHFEKLERVSQSQGVGLK